MVVLLIIKYLFMPIVVGGYFEEGKLDEQEINIESLVVRKFIVVTLS